MWRSGAFTASTICMHLTLTDTSGMYRMACARYQSHLFQDPRTLLAVQQRWSKQVYANVYRDLCMWGLFVFLVLVTAVMATGRDAHYTRSFQYGFEEAILFDEYVAVWVLVWLAVVDALLACVFLAAGTVLITRVRAISGFVGVWCQCFTDGAELQVSGTCGMRARCTSGWRKS